MAAAVERARAALASQPFSVLVGAELAAFDADGVVLELPLRHELQQQHGFAHGGVVSYLADNALTFAAAAALGPAVVTVEMKINYLRPAVGDRLVAKATAISSTRNLAVARCDVFARRGGDDVLCAAAQATISTLPDRKAA